ncbi:energy transducer TonB [Pedobacter glucosidilyticus]|uniref:energy transducer TonB n=1 Tax=Pedobacter glucosidilyticus TaxID=1122941 RepID=UPI0004005835|nr:energy transducer TonB [Pedobacter glucosidilyticus]
MKNLYLLLVLLISFSVSAQKRQNIYFLKENGKSVKEKDSADFIRIIREPDSGMVNYELIEYYKDGKIRRLGHVSSFLPNLVLDGYCTDFYPNGAKEQIGFYQKNLKVGLFRYYYHNGVLREKKNYKTPISIKDSFDGGIVTYLADSLGKSFLDSTGTGQFKMVSTNGSFKEGFYREGLKYGLWKSFDITDGSIIEEMYQLGQFRNGKRIERDGKVFEYKARETLPEFPGGNAAFGEFLSRNLYYPKEAKEQNIKGRIIINFVVEKDGSLANLKILRGIGGGCGEEALRVLSKSPKWKPGIQNGKFVRISYTVPIVFNLQEKAEYQNPFERSSFDSYHNTNRNNF